MYELKKIKAEIRKNLIDARKTVSPDEKELYDKKITEYFLSSVSYRYSQAVLCYCSTKYEVSTDEIILTSLKAGKVVACPVCDTETTTISFRIIQSLDDLSKGTYGLREPSNNCADYGKYAQKVKAETGKSVLAVCIVPSLAFDKGGFRIGYGKGYYDRFLSGFDGAKIGLCHSKFYLQSLPFGKFDVKLDVCITENGLIGFSR